MSPELQQYKTQTLNQLLANLPQLEAQVAHQSDAAALRQLHKQIEAVQTHIQRLQHELLTNTIEDAVADELCHKTARAIVKEKFFLAQKSVTELETIEPFHPTLNLLKQDIMARKAGRQTRAIVNGTAPVFPQKAVPPVAVGATPPPTATTSEVAPPLTANNIPGLEPVDEYEDAYRPWWHNFFEFHILASCAVVALLFCALAGWSGMEILRFIIEGI